MAESVLITGGTGFLGSALTRELRERDMVITFITRSPKPASQDRQITLAQLSQEPRHDVVINLAGESVVGLWTSSKKRAIYDSRIDTTKSISRWIGNLDQKPRVFFSSSATGIYGDRGDVRLTEDADPAQEGFLAKVCVDWEAAAKVEGVRTVFPRTSNVLDPSGGYMKSMLKAMRLFPPVVLGDPRAYVPWISLRDWVDLALFCLGNEQVVGPINFASPEPVMQKEMAEGLARTLGKKVHVDVPAPLLKLLLGQFGESILASERAIGQRAVDLGFEFSDPNLESYLRSA